ncbi:MAG: hypothetical protein COA78_30285 [Blastopirellula sp.]|nr:MAG: hypothetical protein COA78_30285 [Blastopirellula sp.]
MTHNAPELVNASLQGNLAEVQQLVESGADVNSTDQHGMGPLLTFTPAVIEYLLSQGADPNLQTNENGAPVLSGIAYMNNVECVRLLLEGGANPNATHPKTGETPLHSSLARGADVPEDDRHQVISLLLKHGADPNSRTIAGIPTAAFWRDVRTRGETPLHRASAFASKETIQLLLDSGADKSIRDANHDSPQSWASWHWRDFDVVDLLKV